MITSSNFFKKTFFTLQLQTQKQSKKQVGPWQQSSFPKYSTIDSLQKSQKHHYSLLQQYDPFYLDTRRKAQHLKKRKKKQFHLQQFSDVLHILPKKYKQNMSTDQKSQDFILPQLKMRNHFNFKQPKLQDRGIKNTLAQLQQALRKMNNQKNTYNNNHNFIQKNQKNNQYLKKGMKKQSSLIQKSKQKSKQMDINKFLGSHQSFDIYQKCIKSVKKHRYLEPILYSPARRSLG